jgi:hypothetical protein
MSDIISKERLAGVPRPEIAVRAFEIYQRRLRTNQYGSSADDWLQAERELWNELFARLRRTDFAAA